MQGRVTKKIQIANIYNETPAYLENVKTWVNAENAQVGKEHIRKVGNLFCSSSGVLYNHIDAKIVLRNSSWETASRTNTTSTRDDTVEAMADTLAIGRHHCLDERRARL
jgi:hypothetical protein